MRPEDYEARVLEAVTKRLEGASEEFAVWGRKLVHVRLQGAYPQTVILVTLEETSGERRAEDFPVWDDMFAAQFGYRDQPETVATIVYANVTGPS